MLPFQKVFQLRRNPRLVVGIGFNRLAADDVVDAEIDIGRYSVSRLVQRTGACVEDAPVCAQETAVEGFDVLLAPRLHRSRQRLRSLQLLSVNWNLSLIHI